MKNIYIVTALTFAACSVMAAPLPDPSKLPPAAKKEGLTFEKDIHPIFEDNCTRCHGDQRPRGGLTLTTLDAALKGGKDGKVIVPEHSDKSPLVFSVAEIDGKVGMPPKPRPARGGAAANTNAPATPPADQHPWKALTQEQVGLIRAWIDQGAK
jgi:mono/diheme cytochrome c family protein